MLRHVAVPCLVTTLIASGCASTPSAGTGPGSSSGRPRWVHYADWWDEHPLAAAAVLGATVTGVVALLAVGSMGRGGGEACGGVPGLLFCPHGRNDDPTREDREALQGTWQVGAVWQAGRETRERFANAALVVQGDRMSVADSGWVFVVDPKKKPRWIDLVVGDGPPLLGIYQVDGDNLRLCFNERPEGDRPARLVAGSGLPGEVFLVCRRPLP
jgi:uncharacterized protein (TIGR03067 family)